MLAGYCPLLHSTSFIHRLLTGQVVFANSKDLHFFKACGVFSLLTICILLRWFRFSKPRQHVCILPKIHRVPHPP